MYIYICIYIYIYIHIYIHTHIHTFIYTRRSGGGGRGRRLEEEGGAHRLRGLPEIRKMPYMTAYLGAYALKEALAIPELHIPRDRQARYPPLAHSPALLHPLVRYTDSPSCTLFSPACAARKARWRGTERCRYVTLHSSACHCLFKDIRDTCSERGSRSCPQGWERAMPLCLAVFLCLAVPI